MPSQPVPAGAPRPQDPTGPLRLDGAFARRTREDWRAAAEASLGAGGTTLESLARRTLDGLRVDVLYDDAPLEGRRVTSPAEEAAPAPAVRGPASSDSASRGPASRGPENRLRVLGADPAAVNAHALLGLEGGVDSLELWLPLEALDDALRGVHLDMISLSLRGGDDPVSTLDAVTALYRARGLDADAARVALDADPLARLARHGRLDGGAEAAYVRLADVAARAAVELPLASVATIDMTLHHDAGASTVQELVAGVAAATLALERLLDAGLDPAAACRAILFQASCDADLLGGVVKLRALERLWRHVLLESGLAARAPTIVVETSRRHLSTLSPWINHLRNVTACTAATIGGADTLLVHPHDLVDGRRIGDDAAVADRVARNLPILLAEECGLGDVADPAGGAHAIESMTQATAEAAWHALGELQASGGLLAALASGEWQAALARTHAARTARLRDGAAVRVGVNRHRVSAAANGQEHGTADGDDAAAGDDGITAGGAGGVAGGDGAATDRAGDTAGDGTAGDDDAPVAGTGSAPPRAAPLRACRDAEPFESEGGPGDAAEHEKGGTP